MANAALCAFCGAKWNHTDLSTYPNTEGIVCSVRRKVMFLNSIQQTRTDLECPNCSIDEWIELVERHGGDITNKGRSAFYQYFVPQEILRRNCLY